MIEGVSGRHGPRCRHPHNASRRALRDGTLRHDRRWADYCGEARVAELMQATLDEENADTLLNGLATKNINQRAM